MNRNLWILVAVVLLLWASGAFAQRTSNKLDIILAGKMPVAEGVCYFKGNKMDPEGEPFHCVAFATPADPTHVWFVFLDHNGPLYVFEGDNTTGETRLIWWKGKKDV